VCASGALCATVGAAQSPEVTPLNFVFARFASRSSHTLYAGYGIGRGVVIAGMVQNPRTGYREIIAGAGVQVFPSRRNGTTIVLAGADATESAYLQLYVVPSLTLGSVSVTGTVEAYQPLERSGSRQLGINPVTAVVRLQRRLSAGATYLLSAAEGEPLQQAAGPAIKVLFPKGSVTLDLVRRIARFRSEVRLSFQTRF
jgi:hypothetical protein